MSEPGETLDDLLDRLVADYTDAVAAGKVPAHEDYLGRAPDEARPGLERCLKMIDAGTAQAPSPQALAPGLRLGRYELMREIGRGGMALVWLARDTDLERAVALKVLRPGLALEDRHVDRFRREALAIAKLEHRHVVQIFEVGEARGYHFLAMEYIEGPSLASVLAALPKERSWRSDELARAAGVPQLAGPDQTYEQAMAALLAPVAEALHAAHDIGLVHRDVKPSNILLRKDGTAVVADFGLAKADADPALSITGDTLGTPYYMSPEQAWLSEVKVDHRTDVYSLGVTLYEALSGSRPFDGATVLEVFEAIKTQVPASLRSVSPRASKDARAVVERAMAHLPEARYATAEALREDLVALSKRQATAAAKERGGFLRRTTGHARLWMSGHPYEYKSSRTFLGLPLVHIVSGRRAPGQPMRVAKGWYAAGDIAVGGLATGGMALGAIAIGGLSAGLLFSWGGLTAALLFAFGGIAVGAYSFGGVAAGYLVFGGIAIGYAAIGGLAYGKYAAGGAPKGDYVIGDGRKDQEAVDWFEDALPWSVQDWFYDM